MLGEETGTERPNDLPNAKLVRDKIWDQNIQLSVPRAQALFLVPDHILLTYQGPAQMCRPPGSLEVIVLFLNSKCPYTIQLTTGGTHEPTTSP